MNSDDQKVQFQEYRVPRSFLKEEPGLVKWLIKRSGGLIKNEKQATYILFGLVIVAIIVSLFLFFGEGSDDLKKIVPKKPYVDPPKPWAN